MDGQYTSDEHRSSVFDDRQNEQSFNEDDDDLDEDHSDEMVCYDMDTHTVLAEIDQAGVRMAATCGFLPTVDPIATIAMMETTVMTWMTWMTWIYGHDHGP